MWMPPKEVKGAARATKQLKKLIHGKKVEVNTVARDVFGRAIAKVKVNGESAQ